MDEVKKILIAEDDDEIIELISSKLESLKAFNFKIDIAKDGIAAIQLSTQSTYDLIITDLQMPRKSGEEFLKRLKSDNKNKITPTIVCTGFPNIILLEFYSPLFQITKPIDWKNFLNLCSNLLEINRDHFKKASTIMPVMMDGTMGFIRDSLNTEPASINSYIKKHTKAFTGDLFASFDIQMNKINYSFIASLNNDFLYSFNKNIERSPENQEILLHSFLQSIVFFMNKFLQIQNSKELAHAKINLHPNPSGIDLETGIVCSIEAGPMKIQYLFLGNTQ